MSGTQAENERGVCCLTRPLTMHLQVTIMGGCLGTGNTGPGGQEVELVTRPDKHHRPC